MPAAMSDALPDGDRRLHQGSVEARLDPHQPGHRPDERLRRLTRTRCRDGGDRRPGPPPLDHREVTDGSSSRHRAHRGRSASRSSLVGLHPARSSALLLLPAPAARSRGSDRGSGSCPAILLLLVLPRLSDDRHDRPQLPGQARQRNFVGLANYSYFFSTSDTLIAFRNNIIWLVLLTLFATGRRPARARSSCDRVRYESVAKSTDLPAARDQLRRRRRHLEVRVRLPATGPRADGDPQRGR